MKYDMVKLKELCTVNQGLQIPISKRYKEPGENRFFYITVQFLKESGENYYIKNPPKSVICTEDEILVVRTGNTGQVITGVVGCFHNNFFKVTPNEKVFSRYLYYALNNKKMHDAMLNAASGTTIPDLKHSSFYNLEIPLPSIDTQKKISKILDNICNKLTLNNEINNNLYELTNRLFEEKVLNNQDKGSWNEYELSDISKVINGYSYKGSELIDKSDIGMTTIKNFNRTGGFKLDGFKDIIPKKCKIDHYVKPFEVLVACTDLTQNADIIGNAIMLLNNSDYKEVIMSMDLVKLVPTTEFVNNFMLYAIVNSKDFKDFALGYKSGTTVLHLNKNCFKEYTIKLPSEDSLADLSKVIEINYKKISQIIEENKKLEQLKDTLLPKLMNGEIALNSIDI